VACRRVGEHMYSPRILSLTLNDIGVAASSSPSPPLATPGGGKNHRSPLAATQRPSESCAQEKHLFPLPVIEPRFLSRAVCRQLLHKSTYVTPLAIITCKVWLRERAMSLLPFTRRHYKRFQWSPLMTEVKYRSECVTFHDIDSIYRLIYRSELI
jgi:hypothetical protein